MPAKVHFFFNKPTEIAFFEKKYMYFCRNLVILFVYSREKM